MQERQREIVAILNEKGYQSVSELARALYASEPTVRRELSVLEQQGVICRPRGGATLVSRELSQPSLEYLLQREKDRKRQIAAKTAELVENNSAIFLSGADVTMLMLPFLAKKQQITVFTHSLPHAQASARLGIKTVCIGGEVNDHGDVCRGFLMLKMLELLHFNMLFFSPPSISAQGEALHYSQLTVTALHTLLQRSSKSVMICRDHEIWLRSSPYLICRTDQVDYIVCEREELPPNLPPPRGEIVFC